MRDSPAWRGQKYRRTYCPISDTPLQSSVERVVPPHVAGTSVWLQPWCSPVQPTAARTDIIKTRTSPFTSKSNFAISAKWRGGAIASPVLFQTKKLRLTSPHWAKTQLNILSLFGKSGMFYSFLLTFSRVSDWECWGWCACSRPAPWAPLPCSCCVCVCACVWMHALMFFTSSSWG